MTYALIPGAGDSAWYWHRVAPMVASRVPTASIALSQTEELASRILR
jgi:hypothetical protein